MSASIRRTIVIVTPGQLASNPRAVKEAEALHEAGHRVHVVATQVADFVESRDQAVLSHAGFKVTRVPFSNRYFWLLDRVLQQGSDFAHCLSQTQRTADFALSAMTRRLTKVALDIPADLYIAHYVPALPAAARAARKYGALYSFDAEDYHLGDLPDFPKHAHQKALIRRIEQTYLPGAAYVTAASPMIAEAYAETYGIPVPTTILNVFSRKNAPDAHTPRGTASPGPSLYWFSQTIGPGRGLETAIEALSRSRFRPHLYLRGTPAAGYQRVLQDLAAAQGVADRLHFLEPIAPDKLERAAAIYDIGFVGERPDTKNRAIALTNKLFSYWTSSLPTLVSVIPAHLPFVRKHPEFIRPFTDPASLAAILDGWLGDPSQLADARQAAFQAAQDTYNWDREKNEVLKLVDRALSGQTASH